MILSLPIISRCGYSWETYEYLATATAFGRLKYILNKEKNMKKLLALLLSVIMACGLFTFTSCGKSDLKDANVYMFKSTGNTFGDLMWEGFNAYMTSKGEKAVNKSPATTTSEAQADMIDKLIKQGIKSLTISVNGSTGYDSVIKKAKAAGITVTSVDSALSSSLRELHTTQTYAQDIGSALVQAATLIALKQEYPGSFDGMATAVQTALSTYTGTKIKFGILSAGQTTVVQNNWIKWMQEELKKDMYKDKVDSTLTIKYGDDEPTKSTTQANAFVAEDNVDVIISPTTVGMLAAGEVLKNSTTTKIKLTGLGLPSEMSTYMPTANATTAEVFNSVCPYMFLWDVIDLGGVAAASTYACMKKECDGSIGSKFTMSAYTVAGTEHAARTYTVIQDPDDTTTGATAVVALQPYAFDKTNIATWKPLL